MLSEQPEFETPPPRSRTPWIAGGIVLAAAGLLILAVRGGSFRRPELPRGDEHPAVGQRLTRLSLEPLTGNPPPISLDDLHGRVTLINLWGPWCQPCVMEFPHLKELVQHFRENEDFRFVSVSYANGDEEQLTAETLRFLRQQRADFPTYSDPGDKTRRRLIDVAGPVGFPTTLLIGRDGAIRAMWVGYGAGLEREMRDVLEKVLSEPAADAETESDTQPPEML